MVLIRDRNLVSHGVRRRSRPVRPQLSFLHILLGDQPVLTPDAHLYQRLLAMDDQEARAVTEQYRNEHSLPGLYDTVIIPALTLAEQDRHKGALDLDRGEFLFQTLREM